MSDPVANPRQTLVAAWLAMLVAILVLLFEYTTGILQRLLPWPLLWGTYLTLLFSSIWGMKSLLEWQGPPSVDPAARRNGGSRNRRNITTHNLWKLPVEGQMYVLMLIIMLLGALFGKTNTLMLMFALMAGPFIVNGGVTFAMTRRLLVHRHLPERLMAGETVSVDITLENRKRILSSCLLAIEDRIIGPRELLTGKLMFAQVPARQSRTGRYQARFMQRGRYQLGPARVVSRFPLGIVERGLQIEVYDEILVYPRIGILANWWKRRLSDGQETSRIAQGRSGAHHDEFHRIREYRPGDELRSIHWKTTARRNELMVREYRQHRDRRMLLILDLAPLSDASEERQLEVVENAASLATTIGWGHIQECGSQHLDLLCFGTARTEWLGMSHGVDMYGWLDQLAEAEPGQQYSISTILEEANRRQSASTRCVIVTTRPESKFGSTGQAGGRDTPATTNIVVVEADPAKTAEFFTREV